MEKRHFKPKEQCEQRTEGMKVYVIFEEHVLGWCSWRVFSGEKGHRRALLGRPGKGGLIGEV